MRSNSNAEKPGNAGDAKIVMTAVYNGHYSPFPIRC